MTGGVTGGVPGGVTAGGMLVFLESNTTGSGRLFCRRAADLGLTPVLLARDPDRYPYVAQDAVTAVVADTASPRAVRAAIARLPAPVRGVTSSSEFFVGPAAAAARALGLPAPDPEAISRCRDKLAQRRVLRAAGLPVPGFAGAASPAAAVAAAQRIGLPAVLKPVAGSGSAGVRLCADADQVRATAAELLGQAGRILVEEYVSGPEYSVEIFDGQVVGICRTRLGPEPFFVETGHDYPAAPGGAAGRALAGTAAAAAAALGLGWGPVHAELRLAAGQPAIIEVNPRLAGGLIPTLVELADGRDLIAETVARAAGRPPPPPPRAGQGSASIRFVVAAASGEVACAGGAQAALARPGVAEAGFLRAPGEQVTLSGSFRDRLGYVIAAGAGAAAAAEAALPLLTITTRPATTPPVTTPPVTTPPVTTPPVTALPVTALPGDGTVPARAG